jgi:hypothetical protein
MIALTNAGLDYQQALHSVLDFVNDQTSRINSGAITSAEAMMAISTLAASESGLLNNKADSQTTLALESRHWLKAAKRNERERGRLARKRLADGKPKGIFDTAPKSLSHTAMRRDESILQATGNVRPRNDYQQRSLQAGGKPPELIEAASRLSPEAIAEIDRLVAASPPSGATIPPLTGDMAEDIAADLDDPTIPQAPDIGDD